MFDGLILFNYFYNMQMSLLGAITVHSIKYIFV